MFCCCVVRLVVLLKENIYQRGESGLSSRRLQKFSFFLSFLLYFVIALEVVKQLRRGAADPTRPVRPSVRPGGPVPARHADVRVCVSYDRDYHAQTGISFEAELAVRRKNEYKRHHSNKMVTISFFLSFFLLSNLFQSLLLLKGGLLHVSFTLPFLI